MDRVHLAHPFYHGPSVNWRAYLGGNVYGHTARPNAMGGCLNGTLAWNMGPLYIFNVGAGLYRFWLKWYHLALYLLLYFISFTPSLNTNMLIFSLLCLTIHWSDRIRCCRQKRLAWALFVLLFSTLVCCQPTELIWVFLFHIYFPILLPPGGSECHISGLFGRAWHGRLRPLAAG